MTQAVQRDRLAAGRPVRIALFLLWLALAFFLASHHVVWRDEVRALTFALQGDTVGEMLRRLHGEGHPALWYLLLRGGYALWPHSQVLVVAAFLIGAGASLLFAMRAPFGWPLLALGLFGRFAVYEYTVVARNYGISMAILYVFAWAYPKHRDRGWMLGVLLLLLCNTNFPSVLLAGSLLLFWAIDLLAEAPRRWDRRWIAWGLGALLALIGVVLCFLTVYPPVNDAAPVVARHGWLLRVLNVLVRNGHFYSELLPAEVNDGAVLIIPPLLFGTLWQWRDTPAAWIAGLAGTLGLLAVFGLIYGGFYRHEALLLPFLLTIAWLRAEGFGGGRRRARTPFATVIEPYAKIAFPALLTLQLIWLVPFLTRAIRNMPESRSYAFAQLLRRPELRNAAVIGDPDYMVEVVPYYAANPLYLIRERRWGRYAIFSRAAMRTITTDDILNTARRLHDETGRPILIMMAEQIFRRSTPDAYERGTYGGFIATWEGIHRLRAATRSIASYDHITSGDESYEVLLYTGEPRR